MVQDLPLLLLLLWHHFQVTECKLGYFMCAMNDPSQLPYKYYQKGELIVGAIGTQFACLLNEISFKKEPGMNFIQQIL